VELETVQREVLEETGYTLLSAEKIGKKGYVLPWLYKNWTQSHHTAVYFSGQINENCSPQPLAVNSDQDSKGALWFHPDELKEDWCSPLVWEAVQYIRSQHLSKEAKIYESWKVVTKPLYPY
jgi:8-oxo-dGTP pyrophosphatase MutT (NUDIX family)